MSILGVDIEADSPPIFLTSFWRGWLLPYWFFVEEHGMKLATDRQVNEGTKLTGRNATYDTCQLVGIRKPMLMSQLKALAAGAA